MDKFDNEVMPEIEVLLQNEGPRYADYYFSVVLVGKRQENARPKILVSCTNRDVRTEVLRIVKESNHIREAYPEFGFGESSVPIHEPIPSVPLASEVKSTFRTTPNNILPSNDAPSVTSARGDRVLASDRNPSIGRKLFLSTATDGEFARYATGGIVVRIGDKYYQKTVGHIDEPENSTMPQWSEDEVDYCRFDDDSDDEDDNDPDFDCDITSRGSITPEDNISQAGSESYSGGSETTSIGMTFGSSSTPGPYQYPTSQSESILNLVHQPPRPNGGMEIPHALNFVGKLQHNSRSGKMPGLDYGLVLLDTTFDLRKANRICVDSSTDTYLQIRDVEAVPADERDIITVTASGGITRGKLSPSAVYFRDPKQNSLQKLYIVHLGTMIVDGDCGAEVVDEKTGNVYGHIVRGCRGTQIAYIVSAEDLMKDMRKIDKSLKIVIPGQTEKNDGYRTTTSPSENDGGVSPPREKDDYFQYSGHLKEDISDAFEQTSACVEQRTPRRYSMTVADSGTAQPRMDAKALIRDGAFRQNLPPDHFVKGNTATVFQRCSDGFISESLRGVNTASSVSQTLALCQSSREARRPRSAYESGPAGSDRIPMRSATAPSKVSVVLNPPTSDTAISPSPETQIMDGKAFSLPFNIHNATPKTSLVAGSSTAERTCSVHSSTRQHPPSANWDQRWHGQYHQQQNPQYSNMDASSMMPFDPRVPSAAPIQPHHESQYAIGTTYPMTSIPSMAPHTAFGVNPYAPASPTSMVMPFRQYGDERPAMNDTPSHGVSYQHREAQQVYRRNYVPSPPIKRDPAPPAQLPLPTAIIIPETYAEEAGAKPYENKTLIDEMMRIIKAHEREEDDEQDTYHLKKGGKEEGGKRKKEEIEVEQNKGQCKPALNPPSGSRKRSMSGNPRSKSRNSKNIEGDLRLEQDLALSFLAPTHPPKVWDPAQPATHKNCPVTRKASYSSIYTDSAPSSVFPFKSSSNTGSSSADGIVGAKAEDIYVRHGVIIRTNDGRACVLRMDQIDTGENATYMLVSRHLVNELGLREQPVLVSEFRSTSFVRMMFKMPSLKVYWCASAIERKAELSVLRPTLNQATESGHVFLEDKDVDLEWCRRCHRMISFLDGSQMSQHINPMAPSRLRKGDAQVVGFLLQMTNQPS